MSTSPMDVMGVSKNRGTPKSSILIGFSIINHPFWGSTIFGNTLMGNKKSHRKKNIGPGLLDEELACQLR